MPSIWTRVLAASLILLLAVGPAGAQQPGPSADPTAVAAARELLIAMGSDKQFEVAINTMSQGLGQVFKQQAPSKAKEIDEVISSLVSKFVDRKHEAIDMVAPLYAEKFTVQELTEIGAFYKTPIGQKLITTQPGILQRSMQLGMSWGQRIGQEVEAEMRKELKKRGIDL